MVDLTTPQQRALIALRDGFRLVYKPDAHTHRRWFLRMPHGEEHVTEKCVWSLQHRGLIVQRDCERIGRQCIITPKGEALVRELRS